MAKYTAEDQQIIRRAMALLADASNDDAIEAELRAGIAHIDGAVAFIRACGTHAPEVQADLARLTTLKFQGVAMLLLHRDRRTN